MPDHHRHVVIGGGVAGLAAAVWLAEAGKQVTLLERRGRLGGRTHAMKVAAVDDRADNGQHVVASGYVHLFRYLDSVGTRADLEFPAGGALRFPDGRSTPIAFTGVRALRTLFGPHPDTSAADRLRTARATARLGWQALHPPRDIAQLTTAEWFERLGLPTASRAALWDWLALAVAAEPVERGSAKVFADLLGTGLRLGLRQRRPVKIGYPTVDLDSLLVTGAERVFHEHRVDVRHRAVARRIEIIDGAVTGVTLADGSVVPADAVVCAVPAWNVAGLLDDVPGHDQIYAAAAQLTGTPIVSTNLYLDRPLGTRTAMEAVIGGRGVIDEVFDRQRMHGRVAERSWLYCLTTSGADALVGHTNSEIVAAQLDVLRRYYPAARTAEVLEAHVVRMPKATFAQTIDTLGLRPPQQTAVPTLVLAGDWTATDWPSTMESAAQSAARAVELLLARPSG